MHCLFLSSATGAALEAPACERALLFTPDRVHDPFLDDGPPPQSVAQLYFDSLASLEAAAEAMRGPWTAEAMKVHVFPVPQPGAPACTYLVAYEGPADDEAAWHAHYLAHHPPIMARLPGIRELEVYLPIDWRCPASLARVRHMQRNKVAFDDARALGAALVSPVRAEMRKDYAKLPRFSGRVTHHAMLTKVVR